MTECYRCGREGHRAAQCDWQPATPPAARRPLPVPPKRPPHEIADVHTWAEKIRHQLGWKKQADDASDKGET